MSFILEICHDLLYTSMQIKMDDVIVVSAYGLHWNLREERNIRKFSYICTFTYSLNIFASSKRFSFFLGTTNISKYVLLKKIK